MPTIIINAHDHADVTAREPAWENAILVEGNEIFTLTDLSPDTAYTLRWKAPDRQYPDVEVRSCQLSAVIGVLTIGLFIIPAMQYFICLMI